MQVSIETLSGLERRMTIEVPAEQIESKVQTRLQEAAKTFHMKGFRKGKVPLKVIKNRFGKGVRQEVLGEVMSQSYYEAVNKEKVKPAGQPRIEAKTLEEGKNLEFVATFEVYPEISLQDFSAIEVEKKTATIEDKDIDKMIETLRQQRMRFESAEDRAAEDKDQVNIDFEGFVDGEAFEGGEAKEVNLVLGSKRMIPGFEDQLVGTRAGEETTLKVTFPEDYQNKEVAGKNAEFKVRVNNVSVPTLPELNDEFFASFDITEGGLEAFRTEVEGNMARELKNAIRNNVKTQVINGLLKHHTVDVPKALVDNEIDVLRDQAIQQYGGGKQVDKSSLPAELFKEQAERRVGLGLIMGEVIKQNEIKADPEKVRELVEEVAESYEEPEEVVKWYYGDKNSLASVESMAMEEGVIDLVLQSATVKEVSTSYEDALKPSASAQDEDAADSSINEAVEEAAPVENETDETDADKEKPAD